MTERRANETEPRSVLGAMDELLKRPYDGLGRADHPAAAGGPWRLFAGAGLCWVLYGAAAGFFQGGAQIPIAALKAGFIVAGSLLLCVPSLYVFAALTGADLTPRRFLAVVAGFGGMLGCCSWACSPSAGCSRPAAPRWPSSPGCTCSSGCWPWPSPSGFSGKRCA